MRRAVWTGLLIACACSARAAGVLAERGAPAQAPPLAVSMDSLCLRIKELPAIEQLRILQDSSKADPAARLLASAVADPDLIDARQVRLRELLGPAKAEEFAKIARELRGSIGKIDGFSKRLKGIAASSGLAKFWEGDAAAAGSSARVEAVRSSPISLRDGDRRVRAITAAGDGSLLVNGQPSSEFTAPRTEDGVVVRTLVHPQAPNQLVKIYLDPVGMGGHDRKRDEFARREPLSAAGAGPRLLEHGEASVGGLGRVYFLAQEIVEGLKLGALPAELRAKAAHGLFDRLEKAGLALNVPGFDKEWLLSHVVLGDGNREIARAYLLDGETEATAAGDLTEHYEGLRALLEPPRGAPKAEEKLTTGDMAPGEMYVVAADGKLEALLKEHGLSELEVFSSKTPPFALLRFEDPGELIAAAHGLLASPDAARVVVRPDVREAVEIYDPRAKIVEDDALADCNEIVLHTSLYRKGLAALLKRRGLREKSLRRGKEGEPRFFVRFKDAEQAAAAAEILAGERFVAKIGVPRVAELGRLLEYEADQKWIDSLGNGAGLVRSEHKLHDIFQRRGRTVPQGQQEALIRIESGEDPVETIIAFLNDPDKPAIWTSAALRTAVEGKLRSRGLQDSRSIPVPASETAVSSEKALAKLGSVEMPALEMRVHAADEFSGAMEARLKSQGLNARLDFSPNGRWTAVLQFDGRRALLEAARDQLRSPDVSHVEVGPDEADAVKSLVAGYDPSEAAKVFDEEAVGIAATFRTIPRGSFMMGSDLYGPRHEVTIPEDFEMQTSPMTWGQLLRLADLSQTSITIPDFAKDPKNSDGGKYETLQGIAVDSAHSAVNVSWNDAVKLIERLNSIQSEYTYRLPTEAEWEYAARAGSKGLFEDESGFRKKLEAAWFWQNSGRRTHAVGTKPANPFGLRDMHGLVWEWTQDKYRDSYADAPIDGGAQEKEGSQRVVRGAGWDTVDRMVTSDTRDGRDPDVRSHDMGIRLVRTKRASVSKRPEDLSGKVAAPALVGIEKLSAIPAKELLKFPEIKQRRKPEADVGRYIVAALSDSARYPKAIARSYRSIAGYLPLLHKPKYIIFEVNLRQSVADAAVTLMSDPNIAGVRVGPEIKDAVRGRVWLPPLDEENVGPAARFLPISSGAEMQATPVPQRQFELVMGVNPSAFKKKGLLKSARDLISSGGASSNGLNPVESVSWDDTQKFFERLNRMQSEYKYRLPTKAEWKSAELRGQFPASMWLNSTYPVSFHAPDAEGRFIVPGNVREWVEDVDEGKRVLCGKSWMDRNKQPDFSDMSVDFTLRSFWVGFRMVREPRS